MDPKAKRHSNASGRIRARDWMALEGHWQGMSAPPVRHCPGRPLPWMVDLRSVGGGRRFFASEKEARAAARRAERDRLEVGRAWLDLPPKERLRVVEVLREMRAAGVELGALWEAWKAKQVAVSLPGPSLGDAVAQVVAAKRSAGLRPSYVAGLENYLEAFARGRESLPIAAVTSADVLEWFEGRGESGSTKASNIGRLSALFSFSVRAGWRSDNPVDRVERPRVEAKVPVILSVDQAAQVVGFVWRRAPRALAWFVLALFAGIRPEECDRLSWAAVDLRRGVVVVDAAASKVRRRRIVHLERTAAIWLRLAARVGADLPLPFVTRRRVLRSVRDHLGLEAWPQDVLRHSCASYLMASWQDAGRVAAELGNSAGILLRHYRELVRREDAARFWAIRPRR